MNHMKRIKMMSIMALLSICSVNAQPSQRADFTTDTLMVHDPVMALEFQYYILSTGPGLHWATSRDRKTWKVKSKPFIEEIPSWTYDSVPGFNGHVWAPDIIKWNDNWWLAYSCSTFGKNTSAIGLMKAPHIKGPWTDEGCLVRSKSGRDSWNAIDPAFVIDEENKLWLAWGSFWDGIQIAPLVQGYKFERDIFAEEMVTTSPDSNQLFTLYVEPKTTKTIARRVALQDTLKAEPNPTSRFAGRNAIEAPFILKHNGWYYLFVSWDYCCRGTQSNYRVAVGRSRQVDGPYVDRKGKPMTEGGGELFLEGDKSEYEAAGHCAVYDLPSGETAFICHGYSTKMNGASILIQRSVIWTHDGWPVLKE